MDPFSPADLATARHRLYALLGQLLCRGPLPEPLSIARQLPALAEHLDRGEDSLWEGHQSAIMGALPWASAWLGGDGQLGGEIADQARRTLLSCGFDPGSRDEPDHVGILLAGLSHLCAAEAELLRDGAPQAEIARIAELSAGLLDLLLRFLPPFSRAVAEAHDQAWAAIAAFALALCQSQRAAHERPAAPWSLPGALPDPRDPDLGLARIVKTLITPALSGVFLTAHALDALADELHLPASAQDRFGRLELLFRSAALAGQQAELLSALRREVTARADLFPETPWALRGAETAAWLASLRSLHEEERKPR